MPRESLLYCKMNIKVCIISTNIKTYFLISNISHMFLKSTLFGGPEKGLWFGTCYTVNERHTCYKFHFNARTYYTVNERHVIQCKKK